MTVRPIQTSDLKVTKHEWFDSRGRQRVHVSLQGFSWVNKTLWIHPSKQDAPEMLALIKRDITAQLQRRLKGLEKYIQP